MRGKRNKIVLAGVGVLVLTAACTNEDALASENTSSSQDAVAAPPMRLSALENEGRRILVKEYDEQRSTLEMKKAADAILADYLYDPSSAQFRSLQRGKGGAICGKVNAKNRMGAYVGFKDFVVSADQKTVHVSTSNNRLSSLPTDDFADAFLEACATKAEQEAHARATTPTYNYPTPDIDTTDLRVDSDADDTTDPFAEE